MTDADGNRSDVLPGLRDCDHTQGLAAAALLLIEYGSYQCPQSAKAHQAIQNMQPSLKEKCCFVFRHFPQVDRYPQAQKAAETAEAAGSQGQFWEMHHRLFANQNALDDASLVEYAQQLGLDMPQFLREMTQHIHTERIEADMAIASQCDVQDTPTFIVGIRHQGSENLEVLLQQALNITSYTSEIES
ncbi:thioredoxin domain-containing protein [filamentous cyanobacterium LEGE 11480]|uniref:Thioredoxin domain-containing protein n=1 Tax=Romeriopsis navalis LEGE 11480 TaxID=2777977 RepID=A0A928VV94_9CYAN|nr:thioredoxin domain-containing protein [Romeriopsis navalis]MBE9033142.1 thioredoxin domain-containing protein [Romeriopsis navalis LEGE 11480]